jgi:RNA 3'-terminal phosphate cyclase (ATP)
MGEGGGQILRTSLALSLVLGCPLRLEKLRAGRARPGLRAQHLVCVLAAAEISGAEVEGARLGSQQLRFIPHAVRPGEYRFEIGTAGSTSLVLETLLPALLTAGAPTTLTLEGGTHNPLAPPFDFLEQVFLPLLHRMGPKISTHLVRPGYYPRGGGKIRVTVEPCAALQPLHLERRGELLAGKSTATVAGLPRHIAERELQVVARRLGWPSAWLHIDEQPAELGPGNVLTITLVNAYLKELFTGFGQRGLRAETVAERTVAAVHRYLRREVAVGEHLADQILLPLALAGEGSFTTLTPSLHTRTNWQVIQQFLEIQVQAEAMGEDAWRIALHP